MSTIICLIATVFIAVDFDKIKTFIRRNLPERPLRMVRDVRDSFLGCMAVYQVLLYYFLHYHHGDHCGPAADRVNRPVLVAVLIAIFDAFPIVGSWHDSPALDDSDPDLGRGLAGTGAGDPVCRGVIARRSLNRRLWGNTWACSPIVTLICMVCRHPPVRRADRPVWTAHHRRHSGGSERQRHTPPVQTARPGGEGRDLKRRREG